VTAYRTVQKTKTFRRIVRHVFICLRISRRLTHERTTAGARLTADGFAAEGGTFRVTVRQILAVQPGEVRVEAGKSRAVRTHAGPGGVVEIDQPYVHAAKVPVENHQSLLKSLTHASKYV